MHHPSGDGRRQLADPRCRGLCHSPGQPADLISDEQPQTEQTDRNERDHDSPLKGPFFFKLYQPLWAYLILWVLMAHPSHPSFRREGDLHNHAGNGKILTIVYQKEKIFPHGYPHYMGELNPILLAAFVFHPDHGRRPNTSTRRSHAPTAQQQVEHFHGKKEVTSSHLVGSSSVARR